MNDRFKFRVWCKKLEKYVNNINISPFGLLVFNGSVFCFVDDNYIIEQCTGLKDKNGKLVYEGDLLGGLPVVWVNELNGFKVKINTIHGWDWHYINEFTNREITGNIHEQPEQKDVK